MPVEFLSDEQVLAYGRFRGGCTRAELERPTSSMMSIGSGCPRSGGSTTSWGSAVQLVTGNVAGIFIHLSVQVRRNTREDREPSVQNMRSRGLTTGGE